MTKTQNYNLNKPEVTDPMRVGDFNENADIIDAALNSLNTALGGKAEKSAVTAVETALANYKTSNDAAVASKAEQSALNALNTALNGKGNCRIAFGSYVGTGTYDKKNLNVLNFDFSPVLVIILRDLDYVVLARDMTTCQHASTQNSSAVLTMTWSDTAVSWYNHSDAYFQMNEESVVYRYVALGY